MGLLTPNDNAPTPTPFHQTEYLTELRMWSNSIFWRREMELVTPKMGLSTPFFFGILDVWRRSQEINNAPICGVDVELM